MNDQSNSKIARRDVFRLLAIAAVVRATTAPALVAAAKFPDRRKVLYRAESPEVQTFYRVNRYPGKTRR
jgi:hypothetical protein